MDRLFVAVELPATLRQELGSLCFGVPGARWVEPGQIHLTLRFMGEVPGDVARDLRESLTAVRAPAFAMRLAGIGVFPPRGEPRVLWVGVEANDALARLRKKVETTLVRAGLEPEGRKWTPHITLARLRQSPADRLGRFVAGNGLYKSEAFEVDHFTLFRSELTPKGAVHIPLESYRLEKNGHP